MSKLREMIKRKKDQGFTLIELMIVIAVIGILAIVLVPRVGSIKTQARSAGVDTNVRAVQGFVESRISFWSRGTAQWASATAGIQPEIQIAMTGNITNPISGGTTIVSSTDAASSLLAPAGAATTDALQIGGVAPVAASIARGGVVVVSTGTGAGLSIIITGYDNNGSVTSTVTITP